MTDDETGLLLLEHRYYVPRLGRFLTQDPKGQAGGLNLYEYCGDNPIDRSDPSGYGPDDDLENAPDSALTTDRTALPGMQSGTYQNGLARDMTNGLKTTVYSAPLGLPGAEGEAAVGGVSEAIGEGLSALTQKFHSLLDPIAARMRTSAANLYENGKIVFTSSEGVFNKAQKEFAQENGMGIVGKIEKNPVLDHANHAEMQGLRHGKEDLNSRLRATAPSRNACPSCAQSMDAHGVQVINPSN